MASFHFLFTDVHRKMAQIGIWKHSERKRETKKQDHSTQTECVVRIILPVVHPATSESQLITSSKVFAQFLQRSRASSVLLQPCHVSDCPPTRIHRWSTLPCTEEEERVSLLESSHCLIFQSAGAVQSTSLAVKVLQIELCWNECPGGTF